MNVVKYVLVTSDETVGITATDDLVTEGASVMTTWVITSCDVTDGSVSVESLEWVWVL